MTNSDQEHISALGQDHVSKTNLLIVKWGLCFHLYHKVILQHVNWIPLRRK